MSWMRAFSIVLVVATAMLVGTAGAEARRTGPVVNRGNIPVGSCHEQYGIVFYGCVVKTAVFRNKTDHPVRYDSFGLGNDNDTTPFFEVYDTNTCAPPSGPWVVPVGGHCSVQIGANPQSTGKLTGWLRLERGSTVIREKILVATGVEAAR